MAQNPQSLIEPMDAAVVRAVEQLRQHISTYPKERLARVALEGIVEHLIHDVLASERAADDVWTVHRLEQLAVLVPESPTPFLYLSKYCIDSGEHEAALHFAEAGLDLQPWHYGLAFNRALSLLEMGDYEAAIAAYKHCLKLKPDDVWAHNNIGDTYRLRKQYAPAERHLRQALELDERFAPAYYNLALLYFDREDWAACVHYGLKALQYEPAKKEAHLTVGEAHLSLKEYEVGLQHLVTATLYDRHYVEAYEAMSAAYVDLAMYELSVAAAQEALKREPASWRALANIAYGCGKQGKFAEAVKIYQDVLSRVTNPDERYRMLWELGWNCFLADQYAQALDYTDQAVALREHPDLILFFNRALILLAQGKAAEADLAYDQAMAQAAPLEGDKAMYEARNDLQEYVARVHIQLDPQSAAQRLLQSTKARGTASRAAKSPIRSETGGTP